MCSVLKLYVQICCVTQRNSTHNGNSILFTGDSPARAFESGNQVNGHFSCHCGLDIRLVLSYINLTKPRYLTLQARMDVVLATQTWKDRSMGQISVYDNMNVREFKFPRCILQRRGHCQTLVHLYVQIREFQAFGGYGNKNCEFVTHNANIRSKYMQANFQNCG